MVHHQLLKEPKGRRGGRGTGTTLWFFPAQGESTKTGVVESGHKGKKQKNHRSNKESPFRVTPVNGTP